MERDQDEHQGAGATGADRPAPAPALSLEERRERIAAAREAMQGLGSVTWQAPSGGGSDGLSGLMSEIDALGMSCDAGRVAVLREAMNRGEDSGGSAALTTAQWVRHHAPSTKAGGAATIVSVAAAFGKRVNAPVREAVESGRLPVRSAADRRVRGRQAAPAARRRRRAARARRADHDGRAARPVRLPGPA